MMVKIKNLFHTTLLDNGKGTFTRQNNCMFLAHSILTLGTGHLIKLIITCIIFLATFLSFTRSALNLTCDRSFFSSVGYDGRDL
jgi:hypothetical protein